GKVTGPSHAPRLAGVLNGSSLSLGSLSVLTSKTTYDVTIPDFDVARVHVKADTSASIVDIGRVSMPALEGRWSYGVDGLAFKARASDRTRVLEAAGSLRFDGAEQEWRLRRIALSANQTSWALAPSTEAVVRVADGQVNAVEPFTLVGTNQNIVISGRLGESVSESLVARLENVDLAFLAPWVNVPAMAGRLNATL
ncbi:MAG: hypothetical protein ACRD2A_26235, partial [Vicinamibacterales bacterium]